MIKRRFFKHEHSDKDAPYSSSSSSSSDDSESEVELPSDNEEIESDDNGVAEQCPHFSFFLCVALASVFISAETSLKQEDSGSFHNGADRSDSSYLLKVAKMLWQSSQSGYQHVWLAGIKPS